MAAPADAVGPLPDFDVVADSLDTASLHLRRCANIPAVAGMQNVIAAIQQLGTQINARIDTLETRINARIDTMEMRRRASDANGIIRLENARSVSDTYRQLVPLHSMRTGEIIANFPDNLEGLDHLRGDEADAILGELGSAIPGRVEQKRRRIRLYCGVSIR
ncbi:hypothetical protein B0T25DRAFT_562890 [Lasiosphaeria hispida]|uniref:Uncharacterized protein n=1 Tax=Lasiosphaeria hispida TaxID=260671 RepID=A0AAJ0HVY6_9PEZI|nr:hypothetical protein B0T25DRAFT_562890 [Lasiosphaeria hispida]